MELDDEKKGISMTCNMFGVVRFIAIAALLLGLTSSEAPAEYKTAFDHMLNVHRDWVTPHIPWGKPYAHGKPHVLYICGSIGAPREIVELSERLDIDLLIKDYSGWNKSKKPQENKSYYIQVLVYMKIIGNHVVKIFHYGYHGRLKIVSGQ